MRHAVIDVNVGQHLVVAAVNLTMVSHKRGQPPRRASESGTLCCGRVEPKVLGRVVRHAEGLLKRVR